MSYRPESGFTTNPTLSMTRLVHILALPSLVKEMEGLIPTTKSGVGSQTAAPFLGTLLATPMDIIYALANLHVLTKEVNFLFFFFSINTYVQI